MRTFIIMPVANEENTIEKTINGILSNNIENLTVVPIMDRYSTDRTREIIKGLQEKDRRIQLLYYEQSAGVVSCYIFGLKYAISEGADYIIDIDAGGSHDPAELPNFVRYLDKGYDCVFGSRFLKGAGIKDHPAYRILLSKCSTILANMVLGTRLTDMTGGYEAFKRCVLEKIDFDNFLSISTTHCFHMEIRYYCSRLRTHEIPIIYTGSKSVLKLSSLFNSLKILFILRKRNE